MRAALIFPHQLFADHPAVPGADVCVLIEDPLLFLQFPFHAQKLVLHRASMAHFRHRLERQGHRVELLASSQLSDSSGVASLLKTMGVDHVRFVDPCDDWLLQRVTSGMLHAQLTFEVLSDPHFLTPLDEFDECDAGTRRWHFTSFYIRQRQRLGVLLNDDGTPSGGQWSFDPENRRKLPRAISIPAVRWTSPDEITRIAVATIRREFPAAPGNPDQFWYPVTPQDARLALTDFLNHRLPLFGDFEDAIHREQAFLFHSVLTPALNIGLLSPREVVDAALAHRQRVPINALEGFIRQVIGWREYIRGVYSRLGRRQRTSNFWKHTQPLPKAFAQARTGIVPVDTVVRRVQDHAWCHHIERLMVTGSFLLLCEVDPDEVYRWFMGQFIDAYDWVMVPNVYGMSQYADGGLITTKPYLCGSAYVLRMSNFPRGDWCPVWDALYWRFIHRHMDLFATNPRTTMAASACRKLGSKLTQHLQTADSFLERLHSDLL
jgi:deoxyribodipyrimidine photolyase-related protein